MFACIYRPPAPDRSASAAVDVLVEIAAQFSPRYEKHRDDLVSVDVSGLDRLLGPAQAIGEELRRTATARGVRLHIAIARTRTTALVVALARPGLTVVAPGREAEALAPIAIGILEKIPDDQPPNTRNAQKKIDQNLSAGFASSAVKRWGLKTLGELAALPPADLSSRLGRSALAWQAVARGEDTRPLVPMLEEERFVESLELEWPIEELEPLSFVLTRLLEPLSTRLERRDRGAAVLHVILRLVGTPGTLAGTEVGQHSNRAPSPMSGRAPSPTTTRRLELPTPMRDVRALRTLALIDLETHPPGAGIDAVTIVIDPTPGRILQHTLFARAHPTPEQLSTLLARLGALMGHDRIGAPMVVDTYRPGAFVMTAFKTDHKDDDRGTRGTRGKDVVQSSASFASSAVNVVSALRRCRQPVPARVVVAGGRPIRVTTDRRGYAGGAVVQAAGPWRSSGHWWAGEAGEAGRAGRAGKAGGENPDHPIPPIQPIPPILPSWDRDEWDVALSDGAVYRIFQDRATEAWFIDAIVD